MNCCADCFLDVELKGFINSNSNTNGKCDFCKKENTPIVNVYELQEQFIPLLDIYTVDENGKDLVTAIQDDWNVFSLNDSKKIKKLLLSIMYGLEEEHKTLINSKVEILNPVETIELISRWKLFKMEIKKENRFFFNNKANLESIEATLPRRGYSKGKIFYRSRISDDEKGYSIEKMGKANT